MEQKKLKDYTDQELDNLELQSYRAADQLQQELQKWQTNLQVIKLERQNRAAVKAVEKKPVSEPSATSTE